MRPIRSAASRRLAEHEIELVELCYVDFKHDHQKRLLRASDDDERVVRERTAIATLIGTAAVAALAYGAWAVWSIVGGGCENRILSELQAPGGRYRAVVFERSCGATTGFSTQVSVVPARQRFRSGPGNVFIADTDHERAPAGPGGGPEVRISWSGPTRLVVGRHSNARVFLAATAAGEVQVEHSQFGQ